jgi:RNA polymerase sigma-70 factor (sigma-E family)
MSDQADAEFRDFMAARWPDLVRLSYGLTGDQALAEDLAQTALVKAYTSWSRVRRADSPDAYVRRIVINTNSSRMRTRRFSEHVMPVLPDHGAPDQTGQQDDRSALVAALMTLPARQRAVVVLRYWLDLTESQVAATLGCSAGTVKSQASRALAKLRLSPELAGGERYEWR